MFDLSVPEVVLFMLAVLSYLAAGVIGVLGLLSGGRKYRPALWPFVSAAIVLEAMVLALRGVSIRGVPLTGLFDSLIVLTIVLGALYLLFSVTMRQVWFSAVMVWVIVGMILMAGFVAEPAARPRTVAATPWAITHGAAMVLAAACVLFSAANASLYLLGSYKLKHKAVLQVLGKIPNMETLCRMNLIGLKVGFVLVTIGIAGGFGLIWLLGTGLVAWLTDAKVICILAAWGLLATILLLDRLTGLKDKTRAYITIAALVLILFAVLGVTIVGATQHEFSLDGRTTAATDGRTLT